MNYLNWQAWFYILWTIIAAYLILRTVVIELRLLITRIGSKRTEKK